MKNLLCLLLFISCSVVGFGQQDSMFTIEGTVWDEMIFDSITNEKIISATVYLLSEDYKELNTVYTDFDGKYEFSITEKGCYHVKATYVGLSDFITTDCILYEKRKIIQQDVILKDTSKIDWSKRTDCSFDTMRTKFTFRNTLNFPVKNIQLTIIDLDNEDTASLFIKDNFIILPIDIGIDYLLIFEKSKYESVEKPYDIFVCGMVDFITFEECEIKKNRLFHFSNKISFKRKQKKYNLLKSYQ